MKKLISIILMAVLLMSSVSVLADNPIRIYIDGTQLISDVDPVIVNSRTMVPLRVIFEALGAEVSWIENTQKVFSTLGDKNIMLTIGSQTMYTNDDVITLDAAPFIKNDRTMVPVRAVGEAFGCTVSWHDISKSVVIRTPNYTGPSIPASISQTTPKPKPVEGDSQYKEVIVNNNAYYEIDSSNFVQTTTTLINNYRTQAGLEPLEYSKQLETVAYNHSKDMADNNYISHTSPSGVEFNSRIDNAGISYISAAEVIASGFISADKVVESWMNSESHKNNILNPAFTKLGLGYYAGGSNGTYWTLLLING